MKVSVIGSGYVGTTLAACLVDLGHEVVAIDIDQDIVDAINAGETPVHEPGLSERIAEYGGDSLVASSEYADIVDTDLSFICVQTPPDEDGRPDTSIIEAAARSLGTALESKDGRHAVVTKSTVLPGTTESIVARTVEDASGRSVGESLGIAMNPEFLREGSAVEDFHDPDKIVVGTEQDWVRDLLHDLYADLIPDTTVVDTGLTEAETIKYANNAFLATKVSFANELGNICKEVGVDSYEVADAMGLDHRIGASFLRSGLGWGGSCFPKDVDALRSLGRDHDYEPSLLDATVDVNDKQPSRLVDLLSRHVDLDGARIAVLGLAFKPGTDDVRGSRAIDVAELLHERGATPMAYDPVATENARAALPDIAYVDSADAALDGADGAVLATEWDEFEALDFSAMNNRILVDGRRVDVDRSTLDVYEGLCW